MKAVDVIKFVKEINPQDATPELLGGYMTGLKS